VERRLNVARWIRQSAVNGPGERFVLWVQGCTLRCAGCWNPDTWSSAPRRTLTTSELLGEIPEPPDVEGITLTGGEPFEQAEALVPLAGAVRARGQSVFVFTGYDPDELITPAQRTLLDLTDVLVAGRYRRDLGDSELPWRGSSNQQVVFLSERYGPADVPEIAEEVEVHIGRDGTAVVTGFPGAEWRR